MAERIQLVDVDFGKDVNAEIERYVHEQIEWLERAHTDLHKTRIPKWRKTYLGTPSEATRNFPFPNAANTIVQVIGETVDTMVARVMGLVHATKPLWVFQNFAKSDDPKVEELRKQTLEDFMDLVGMEPNELDLQMVEALWFTDASKLGTAFLKLSIEQQIEAVVVGYEGDAKKRVKGHEETVYAGPRVSNLRHEDVLVDPSAQTLAQANMVVVRKVLRKFDLEERGFTERFYKEAVEEVLKRPDRSTPREQTKQELQDQGIMSPPMSDSTAEWDIYECFFPWWHNGRKYRLVYSYHKASRTVMRKVFNFLPNNDLPVKRARLGYRTNGMYGHGYAELLDTYQEELSTVHNQRLDNATVANVRALRVSPRARALDSNMELYPASLLIGEKDEIESIQVGDVYPSTFQNEEVTLGLVARRAGISPAVSGAGTGGMMKKPQVYSSQGTLAVMQENNSVVGFATSEFRHAHVMLGSALTAIYGKFGTHGKEEGFGVNGAVLQQALKEFMENRMRIPIRASTGSLNKEIDKQTGMLMAGLIQRHYTAVGQLLQALDKPMLPENAKDYFMKVVAASELFHKKVLRDFGYEQPDMYIPEAKIEQQGASGGANKGAGPQGGVASQGSPMAGAGQAAQGGGQGAVPTGNLGSLPSGIAPTQG